LCFPRSLEQDQSRPRFVTGVGRFISEMHLFVTVRGVVLHYGQQDARARIFGSIRGLRARGVNEQGEAGGFSDGVIAIIITIMVLEMKVPHGDRLEDLVPLVPTFLSYVLSFLYVGIYWNNHHHMLHASTVVTAAMMWANLQLLFWLSLFPFATGWMGQNHFTAAPSAVYG